MGGTRSIAVEAGHSAPAAPRVPGSEATSRSAIYWPDWPTRPYCFD